MIDNSHKIKSLEYVSLREAVILIEWFDEETNKKITMRGLVEEVEDDNNEDDE